MSRSHQFYSFAAEDIPEFSMIFASQQIIILFII